MTKHYGDTADIEAAACADEYEARGERELWLSLIIQLRSSAEQCRRLG
jgi:hypothetical protein